MKTNNKINLLVLASVALLLFLISFSCTAVASGQLGGQGSPITVTTSNGNPLVYYFDSNAHVYELAYTGKKWVSGDVTASASGQPGGKGGPITATTYGGNPRVYYFDGNAHVYELAYTGTKWVSGDLTASA